MTHNLLDAAEDRWREVNSPELVAEKRASIEIKDGTQIERKTQGPRDDA